MFRTLKLERKIKTTLSKRAPFILQHTQNRVTRHVVQLESDFFRACVSNFWIVTFYTLLFSSWRRVLVSVLLVDTRSLLELQDFPSKIYPSAWTHRFINTMWIGNATGILFSGWNKISKFRKFLKFFVV